MIISIIINDNNKLIIIIINFHHMRIQNALHYNGAGVRSIICEFQIMHRVDGTIDT